jgi:hypothetical protein
VLPGAVPPEHMDRLAVVYDSAVASADLAKSSVEHRRSIQGAFIPREGSAAVDWSVRLKPETLTRMGALARYLLAV